MGNKMYSETYFIFACTIVIIILSGCERTEPKTIYLNPWVQGGCRVQDIGIVESKNLSFTLRLSGHFLNRCGIKSLCYALSWTHGFRYL